MFIVPGINALMITTDWLDLNYQFRFSIFHIAKVAESAAF